MSVDILFYYSTNHHIFVVVFHGNLVTIQEAIFREGFAKQNPVACRQTFILIVDIKILCTFPGYYVILLSADRFLSFYSIQETPVIGQVQETPDFYDLISVVMVCLEKQAESEETRHTNDTAVHTAQPQSSPLLGLLNTLLSSKMDYQQKARILQDDYHIPMAQGLTEEVTHMTHIVDEIGMRYAKKAYAEGTAYGLTKGIAQGRTEGIAQGRTEGIAQGRTEGIAQGRTEGLTEGITQGTQTTLTDSIRNLMTALQFSTKQAMDILQVPEADRPLYEELLQKRELELASNESDTAQ